MSRKSREDLNQIPSGSGISPISLGISLADLSGPKTQITTPTTVWSSTPYNLLASSTNIQSSTKIQSPTMPVLGVSQVISTTPIQPTRPLSIAPAPTESKSPALSVLVPLTPLDETSEESYTQIVSGENPMVRLKQDVETISLAPISLMSSTVPLIIQPSISAPSAITPHSSIVQPSVNLIGIQPIKQISNQGDVEKPIEVRPIGFHQIKMSEYSVGPLSDDLLVREVMTPDGKPVSKMMADIFLFKDPNHGKSKWFELNPTVKLREFRDKYESPILVCMTCGSDLPYEAHIIYRYLTLGGYTSDQIRQLLEQLNDQLDEDQIDQLVNPENYDYSVLVDLVRQFSLPNDEANNIVSGRIPIAFALMVLRRMFKIRNICCRRDLMLPKQMARGMSNFPNVPEQLNMQIRAISGVFRPNLDGKITGFNEVKELFPPQIGGGQEFHSRIPVGIYGDPSRDPFPSMRIKSFFGMAEERREEFSK